LRCPRIDPTGERFLIWPKDEIRTPIAAAPVVAGNIQAPPVGTDPVFPQPEITTPTAPPGAVAPVVTPASASMVPMAGDRLLMMPERVLAPVGSEVVLKASICATEGYTLADQKVEWMLGRNGVGQFVEVSGKGLLHPPLLPWAKGSKVDNYLAHGYTATGPLCITRGTPDPTDDVNINRGDAWISVTSANEGVSHVTAFTPAVESWDQRKASATIYWIDVQWTFPPPSVNSSGRGETLTTLVTRQSDGSPIEGWIVRYAVADGGPPSEVRTGPDGRASVDVAPTAAGAASSRIDVQLIRPAGYGGGDAPRLIIGSGTTIVNWTGASQPYLSPGVEQPPSSAPPIQSTPAQPMPQNPITPQPQLPSATPARLELDVRGPSQAAVGGTAQFQVVIRNVGDSTASGVSLTAQLDPGLVSPNNPTSDKIGYNVGTLGPRETRQIDLPFQVNKSGQLCHEVAVEFSGGAPVTKRSCLTGIEGAPQREARLEVQMAGDLQRAVGETATFRVVVKNIGQTPLTNIEVIEEYPPAALQPQPAEPGVQVISGTITRRIDRLEVGQQKTWETPCLCRQATRVTPLVRVTADPEPPGRRIASNAEHTLEILLPRAAPPAGATGTTSPPVGAAASPLSVKVSILNQPVLVNSSASVMVTVTNKSGAPEEQVALRVFFPANVTPDAANASGPPGVTAQVTSDRLVFSPIAVLAVNETASYRIPINPTQVGIVQIQAQAVSRNVRQGVSESANLEIVSNRY
jgi:uncharacterized repeat protein (TIGR01451 family)